MRRRQFGAGLLFIIVSVAAAIAETEAGPWNVAALRTDPAATWGSKSGVVQQVYYAGEPYHGRPTRVFAYYGRPEGEGPFPAVLLVHGGGGRAFSAWVSHWAQKGYVALAMDLAGQGPAGRLADGGPGQDDKTKFQDISGNSVRDMWTYHAVAAVLRGHGLLASRKEVDPARIAVTGISWGGYLTCIVAGLDDQLAAAVPVYGCGFLHENSVWVKPQFAKMNAVCRQRWVENFDPSRYLGLAKCPMLFVDGTCDFAYPMDSLRKSYELVKSPVTLSVMINRKHGHIWTFPEVDAFIDSHLKGGAPMLNLSAMTTTGSTVSATVSGHAAKAELDYTVDGGPWQERRWETAPATVSGGMVTATLPARRPLVYYLYVTDKRGCAVSTPHAEVKQ